MRPYHVRSLRWLSSIVVLVVVSLGFPIALATPAAAADGEVQGTVTLPGGAPLPQTQEESIGVKACAQPSTETCAPVAITSVSNGGTDPRPLGAWNLSLAGNASYDLYVVNLGNTRLLAGPFPVFVPESQTVSGLQFEPAVAFVEATVTDNGTPFPPNAAVLGACLEPLNPSCPSGRNQRDNDGDGAVTLALPPTEPGTDPGWNLIGIVGNPQRFSQERYTTPDLTTGQVAGPYTFQTFPPSPSPSVWADAVNNEVRGGAFGQWPSGVNVNLSIDDPGTPASPDYTDSAVTAPNSGGQFMDFRFVIDSMEFDLLPGHLVTVSDGTNTKSLTVTNLAITGFDYEANSITGTAEPGSAVSAILVLQNFPIVNTQADGNGVWTTTFGVDLTESTGGGAWQQDGDNDRTAVFFGPAPPANPATVQGTILGDGGAVLPNSGGALCPAPSTGTDPNTGLCNGLLAAFADGSGHFSIGGVPAGSYSAGGFQMPQPGGPVSPTVIIDVAPGDVVACAFTIGTNPSASCTGATAGDDDGVPGAVEDGAPNNGDGNGDGTPDAQQENVASLPNIEDGEYVTVAAPADTTLTAVQSVDADPLSPPGGLSFPAGLVNFTVTGVAANATADVEVHLPTGTAPSTYWKYHDGWYDFSDQVSGLGTDVLTLHLTNGETPDDADGSAANDQIVDPSGPSVPYDFNGFFSPVDNPPTRNGVKAGQAIPVKFSLNGDHGLEILAASSPTSHKVNCDTSDPLDDIESTVSAGSSSVSYDPATDAYTYVWKTKADWSGTCRELVVKLADGTEHTAVFQFR